MTSRWIDPPTALAGLTRDGTYHNVDLSAYLPIGATGVMLLLVNPNSSTEYCGVRHPDSTFAPGVGVIGTGHMPHICGVNAARQVAINIGGTSLQVTPYVVGFFGAEASFFPTPVSLLGSMTCDGAWHTLDLSGSIPASAIAAIITYNGTSGTANWDWRHPDSTDDMPKAAMANQTIMVALDGTRACEYRCSTATNVKFELEGYVLSGMSFNTNAVSRATATTGSYVDVAALPVGALGGLYRMVGTLNNDYYLRKNGDTTDLYRKCGYSGYYPVQCDANRVIEQKIGASNLDLYELGWWTANPQLGTTPRRRLRGVGT